MPGELVFVSSFTFHEGFAQLGGGADAHDIAIVTLASAQAATPASLPTLGLLNTFSRQQLRQLDFTTGGYGIAPNGFLARTGDGAVIAGTFSGAFDGFALWPGSHDLVVTRTSSAVTVHQPLGSETPISVRLPSSWQAGSPVRAEALARSNPQ